MSVLKEIIDLVDHCSYSFFFLLLSFNVLFVFLRLPEPNTSLVLRINFEYLL